MTAFCRGLSAAGTFGLNVVLARQLPLADYGNLAVCLTAVLALAIFSRFGFETSLLRFGGAAWHDDNLNAFRRVVNIALKVVTSISVVVAIVIGLLLWVSPFDWAAGELLRTVLIAVPFLAISSIVASGFKAAHRPEAGALFEVGGVSLLACCLVLVLPSLGYAVTAQSAAIIYVGSSIAFCAIGLLSLTLLKRYAKPTNDLTQADSPDGDFKDSNVKYKEVSLKEYLTTSSDFLIVAGTQFLGNWSGVFFVEYFQDETAAALFSAARRTSLLPLLLLSVVVAICSPKLAGLFQASEPERFQALVHRSSLIVCAVNVPILLVMAIGAPWWMNLFGSDYQSHWILLTVMSCGQLVGAVTGIATGVMGMTGQQQLLRRISIVSAVAAVILSAVLSATMGVLGAAIAGAFYAAGQSLAVTFAVRKQLGYFPTPRLR
nr:oligosaccharide flippase family protein [Rubripirellula obstinata]